MLSLPNNPEVLRIVVEMDALNAAVAAIEDPSQRTEARALVRLAQEHRMSMTDRNIEDVVVDVAMAHIVGTQIPDIEISLPSPDQAEAEDESAYTQIIRILCLAWISVVVGQDPQELLAEADRLRGKQAMKELRPSKEDIYHLMALVSWKEAIEALARKQQEEALRLWRRSYELGTSFASGTESHPLVLWTMAASFFCAVAANSSVEPPYQPEALLARSALRIFSFRVVSQFESSHSGTSLPRAKPKLLPRVKLAGRLLRSVTGSAVSASLSAALAERLGLRSG